jgi:hypothetical protein
VALGEQANEDAHRDKEAQLGNIRFFADRKMADGRQDEVGRCQGREGSGQDSGPQTGNKGNEHDAGKEKDEGR